MLQVTSPLLQTTLFAAALLAFLIAHMSWRPYEARSFYLAELASMTCLLLTANLATLATTGPSALADLSQRVQIGAAIVMIAINFAVVLGLAALYGRTCLAAQCTEARRRSFAARCSACGRGRRAAARAAFAAPHAPVLAEVETPPRSPDALPTAGRANSAPSEAFRLETAAYSVPLAVAPATMSSVSEEALREPDSSPSPVLNPSSRLHSHFHADLEPARGRISLLPQAAGHRDP